MIIVNVVGFVLCCIGILSIVKPHVVGDRIAAFYKKYPLVRMASNVQFSVNKIFVMLFGATLLLLGIVALVAR